MTGGSNVRVRYDPQRGYPIDVQIDMHTRPVDGGTHWIIADLQPLTEITNAEQLTAARERWDAQGLTSYTFVMQVACDCPENGTVAVEVSGDRVVAVHGLDEAAQNATFTPTTINATFDDLAEWFHDPASLALEGIIDVAVFADPVLGFPRRVTIEADELVGLPAGRPVKVDVTLDLVGASRSPDHPDIDEAAGADLARARSRWEDSRPTSYRFTVTNHCMCPAEFIGPFAVRVHGNQIVEVTRDGARVDATVAQVSTIDEMFEMIEAAIDSRVRVEIAYHPAFGYPEVVVIDVDAVAVDGGISFSVGDLAPLEEPGRLSGVAVAAPTCPVLQDPPAGACEDRPVDGARLVIFDDAGREVGHARTDPDGHFTVWLPPGSYRVEPQPVDGLPGTPGPFEIRVTAGAAESVRIVYDTGIR